MTSMNKVAIKDATGATAETFSYGAHLTSWKTDDGEELIFVSSKALFTPPKAIRGGIPVCFPQFAKLGPLQQHGFARNVEWEVESTTETSATFALKSTEQHQNEYNFTGAFLAKLEVSLVEGSLVQKLSVQNNGTSTLEFTVALHTYFSVSNISIVRVKGLKGCKFFDSVDGGKEKIEENDAITFGSEVDRIYCQVPRQIQVEDTGRGRCINLELDNFLDAVVWNPWKEKAQGMADFADDEYKEMVCVEAAVAKSGPVKVDPGQSWTAKQVLKAVPITG